MFKRISIFLIVLSLLLAFTIGVGATAAGLFVEKDAGNTYINYVDADGTSIMKIDDTDGVTIAVYTADNTYTSMTITTSTDASSLTVGSIVTPGGIACAKQLFLGDDIDMSVSGTGVYDITLRDTVNDALSIVGGSTDMMVFDTDTDAILIVPPLTVTGLITSNGGIAVGASGAGFDVTFYGDTATADFVWDQNGDTNGSLTLGADTVGVDFKVFGTTTGNYLIWDRSADDLLLVGTATQLGVAGTTASTSSTTGSIHTAGGLGVAGAAFIGGVVEVGADAAGTDFTVYGDVTAYKTWWDANGDTNGAWYFGADTKGVLVSLYGDTTGCGVFWNPSTDTNGTLTIGGSGGSKGVDVIAYGTTNGKYVKWDQSADGVVLVGTLAMTGAITMGTTSRLNFTDANAYIYASASTALSVVSATILLDGDTTINAAHAFTTGTGAATFLGQIVTSYNGNPSVSIGSSGTPLTTATTAYSALKCWSDYSLGTAGTYHVGAWFISNYTATATWGGSVFALRGSAGVSATETTVNTAGQIIGVHGRILSSGTMYNAGVMYAGVLGQVCIGGTWTAANKVAAGWFDWQLNTQVAAGDTMILYLSNNANSGTANLNPTNVMYIYAPYVTYLLNLNAATNGGMVAASATAGTMTHTVKCYIDGVAAYLHFYNQ